MGIIVLVKEIQGGRGKGPFKRRLMKFQGRDRMYRSSLYKSELNSQDKRRGVITSKLLCMVPEIEKRSALR